MRVFNKSNKEQKVRVRDRYGKTYSVYIRPHRYAELDPIQVSSSDVADLIKSGVLIDCSTKPVQIHDVEDRTKSGTPIEVKVTDTECACTLDEITDDEISEPAKDLADETPEPTNDLVDKTTEDVTTDTINESEELSDSVFKCDICGNEYASGRGLQMHKNKSHNNS